MRLPELYESLRYFMLSLEPHYLEAKSRDEIYRELETFSHTINNKNLKDSTKLEDYQKAVIFMLRQWEDGKCENCERETKEWLKNGERYETIHTG